jgi:hypothetical protein
MALFDKMTAAERMLFLQEAIAGIEDKEQASQAREIADAWRKADVAALEALALKAEQDDYSGPLRAEGAAGWPQSGAGRRHGQADGARKQQRGGNRYPASGRQDSVPELLRKRGLKVERIY